MTITFDIKKNNAKKNPSNNKSASKALDALILSKLMGKKPAKEERTTVYKFTPKKTKSDNPLLNLAKPAHKEPKIDFFTAFTGIISSPERDTYDFKLSDGTPIKIFSDEIQIGYQLFDRNNIDDIYKMLSEERRQNIIDIYINITRK